MCDDAYSLGYNDAMRDARDLIRRAIPFVESSVRVGEVFRNPEPWMVKHNADGKAVAREMRQYVAD